MDGGTSIDFIEPDQAKLTTQCLKKKYRYMYWFNMPNMKKTTTKKQKAVTTKEDCLHERFKGVTSITLVASTAWDLVTPKDHFA